MGTKVDTKEEQQASGFYERARERLRRALAESPTQDEIRARHDDATTMFEHAQLERPRHLYRPEYRSASVHYQHDSDRLRRALGEIPREDEIRRHRDEAIAAFGREERGRFERDTSGEPDGGGRYMGYGGFGRRYGRDEERWSDAPFWQRR